MSDTKIRKTRSNTDACLFFTFLTILLVTADQFFKKIIDTEMEYNSIKDVIPKFFSFHYVRNTGSAFSLFADKEWGIYFLTGVSVLLGVVIFIFMLIAAAKDMKLLAFAFCLLTSGAIGNLIDRIFLKYVIDFLRFDFGSYTFPIFNFADICAVIGTVLLICIIIFASKYFETFWNVLFKKKKKADSEEDGEDEEEKEDSEEESADDDVEVEELSVQVIEEEEDNADQE